MSRVFCPECASEMYDDGEYYACPKCGTAVEKNAYTNDNDWAQEDW